MSKEKKAYWAVEKGRPRSASRNYALKGGVSFRLPELAKADPLPLASGRCRCGKTLPEVAVLEADPFCSADCARGYHAG